jgi:uncharacterized membrane protein YphA (DoxX/SURF4 family)
VKLGDPIAFLKLIRQYEMGVSPAFLNSVAIVLPWLEIVCGAALINGVFMRGAAALMALMLVAFTPVVLSRAFDIMAEKGIPFMAVKFDCGCGAGEVYTWKKTIENIGLLFLCLVPLLSASRRFCLELWLARRNPESKFCHFCGYYTARQTAGICEKCATPRRLPIGEPIA